MFRLMSPTWESRREIVMLDDSHLVTSCYDANQGTWVLGFALMLKIFELKLGHPCDDLILVQRFSTSEQSLEPKSPDVENL